jgi:hypothetical protein
MIRDEEAARPVREARCSCGRLRLRAHGEPLRVSICHCLACQQRTGSAFGVQARFARENVSTQGAASTYVRMADSGNTITYHFCPDCGSTVWYRLDRVPEVIAVPVGAFADPAFPPPRFSVWESRRHRWAGVPVDAEHHD